MLMLRPVAQHSPIYQTLLEPLQKASTRLWWANMQSHKIFLFLNSWSAPNDHEKQEGTRANAEIEVLEVLCWSKLVALWFIFRGRHYTHWVGHKISLGWNLSRRIRVLDLEPTSLLFVEGEEVTVSELPTWSCQYFSDLSLDVESWSPMGAPSSLSKWKKWRQLLILAA